MKPLDPPPPAPDPDAATAPGAAPVAPATATAAAPAATTAAAPATIAAAPPAATAAALAIPPAAASATTTAAAPALATAVAATPAPATPAAPGVAPAPAATPDAPPLALVFGASGYVGRHLVPRLCAEGWRVRAAARNLKAIDAFDWPGVDRVRADALQPDTLPAALAGVQIAYYLVHSMAAGRDFGALDLQAATYFAAAAAAAGVQRIVYLGGLIPADATSEHLVSRRDTGERLRAGPVPVTEIRAGIIVGPGSAAFEVMRDLIYHVPVTVSPRWVRSRSSPIALPNLLEYLVRVATLPAAAGRIYDAGSPSYLSYEAMMRGVARHLGRRIHMAVVPVLTPRLSSYWLGLITSVPTPIGRALIEGLRHDLPADDAPLRALVPQNLLDFDQAVAAALTAERQQEAALVQRWTEGALKFRGGRPDHAYYAKRAGGSAVAYAPPAAVWQVITKLGGAERYFYADILWTIREWLDAAVGGPGLQRGRTHPGELRVGDKIDSWTVMALVPQRRLTLHFGMKAPGSGVLEFELEPQEGADGDATKITVTAYWHPAGVWGLSYWYAMVPAHLFLFKGMTREIARRAEAVAGAKPPRSTGKRKRA